LVKYSAYLDLEDAVHSWCRRRPDILAAVVIGSRGRQPATPDPRSDLDLILFCQRAASYQQEYTWLNEFGEVWVAALSFVRPGHPEWMAYLAPGVKVDFLFVTAEQGRPLVDMLGSLPYQQVLSRGFRILYQSSAAAGMAVSTAARAREHGLPTDWAFHQKVNSTLLTAERFVKFSIREDGWRSRYTFEAELRAHLLAFIEWHAQTRGGPEVDTWYEGRYMTAWADSRVVEAIRNLDPGHTLTRQQAALLAFLDLFQLLAGETAARLSFEFPTPGQSKMMDWLKVIMRGAAG
jgi:hypothetical protein